jgi:hypothetical protein
VPDTSSTLLHQPPQGAQSAVRVAGWTSETEALGEIVGNRINPHADVSVKASRRR